VKGRNLATRSEVVCAVLLQQAIQTILGLAWVTEDVHRGPGSWGGEMEAVGTVLVRVVRSVLGKELGGKVLQANGPDIVYFLYWWGIPAAQFCLAMYVCVVFYSWPY
jgi:sphinganine C4-monooxygenase